jgi:hypothetical protein
MLDLHFLLAAERAAELARDAHRGRKSAHIISPEPPVAGPSAAAWLVRLLGRRRPRTAVSCAQPSPTSLRKAA